MSSCVLLAVKIEKRISHSIKEIETFLNVLLLIGCT